MIERSITSKISILANQEGKAAARGTELTPVSLLDNYARTNTAGALLIRPTAVPGSDDAEPHLFIGTARETAMDLQWVPSSSRFALQANRPPSPLPHRSPHKRQGSNPTFSDPLLSNLSPSSTLEALQASDSVPSASQNGVYESIAAASSSERALAIRAATAGKHLKEWCMELQGWEWPSSHNGFQCLSTLASGPQHSLDEVPAQEIGKEDDTKGNLWGSLPAQTVLKYEARIEQIRDGMLALELDDLKMHVRNAHPSATFGQHLDDESNYSTRADTNCSLLDDLTAIVTMTTMQTLPFTYRLEALMGIWEARLAVLRAIPAFTKALNQTQEKMAAAWTVLENDIDKTNPEHSFNELKANMESRIRDLGQRLDYMLDCLEGRQDTIPDRWIDSLERLEAEFCDWAVEVEKMVFDRQVRLQSHLEWQHLWEESPGATLSGNIAESNYALSSHSVNEHFDGSSDTPSLTQPPDNSLTPNGYVNELADKQPRGHRPIPLDLQHRRNHSNAPSDFSSDASYPGSATSDYFSNMSSPEIHDASKTEYFEVGSPVEVVTPGLPRSDSRTSQDTVTRQSSQRTQRGETQGSVLPTVSNFPMIADAQAPIPAKSRHRFEEVADLSPGNTPVKIIRRKTVDAVKFPSTPQDIRTPTASPTKSVDERLEARISSILTDIPADIRLARGSSAGIVRSPAKSVASATNNSPTTRLMRSQTTAPSPPAMTLTPAGQKGSRAQNGESDVKEYHLQQSGQEPPIKLFVRLVGENGERVMVRIGGGWADLGEYLKEYAIHHGRRTVSGGQFDIQGLPHSQSSSPATTLGSLTNNQTPRSRPDSPIAGSLTQSDDFRPTSRDSNMSRRSWAGNNSPSLGLAGPKSRKAAVSPNKQAWVDTMMEKARGGSGEKKKDSTGSFGDLGILGGTKRLFMKSKIES
ncbi:MAG: hypothetical protein Q9218_004911 [Villophora microphyllina]